MQRGIGTSNVKHASTRARTDRRNVKSLRSQWLLALAAAFAVTSSAALAQPQPAREDRAQLAADQSALAREAAQLEHDQTTLKADSMAGKMAAESKDDLKVYEDIQAINGENEAVANDLPGSGQMSSDMAALQREERQLDADRIVLKANTRDGRMAAVSADGDRVYNDRLAIEAQKNRIATDRTKVAVDENR